MTSQTKPRQLVLGFAMGMLVGLVPKVNLTAMALTIRFCESKVNPRVATFSALIFSWMGLLADPLDEHARTRAADDRIATAVVDLGYNTPIIPWTDFNNTVVLSSFVSGTALLPVYLVCRPALQRLTPVI